MDRTQVRHRQAIRLFSLIAAVLLAGSTSLAQAQNGSYWNTAGPADWTSANWTSAAFPGDPSGSYYLGNGTVINNGGTATIGNGDFASDKTATGNIFIGGSGWIGGVGGNGNGYVTMTGGTLGPVAGQTFSTQEWLGNTSGSGVFTQSGGINCPFVEGSAARAPFTRLQLGPVQGGYGEYDMSGGSLGVNAVYVGGNSDFNGITTSIGGPLNGGTGVFTQTGGSVGRFGNGAATQAVGLFVGGGGALLQSQQASASQITTTSSGIYTLSDPNHTAALFVGGYEVVGVNGTGTFNQTGGTNVLAGGGSVADKAPGTPYNDSLGVLFLGFYGNKGAISGGWYGSGVGTYNLSGGLLTGDPNGTGVSGYEVVGQSGTGIFTQSGGTNAPVSGFYVGGTKQDLFGTVQFGGSGNYTLTNNGLLDCRGISGAVENIGQSASGTFTQTGGTNLCTAINLGGSALVFPSSGGLAKSREMSATYYLGGGLLQTAHVQIAAFADATPCTFNFTGGTVQAGATGFDSIPITVGTAASNVATFDANSKTVTLPDLSGPGQVRVIDSAGGGTVLRAYGSNNTYTGGTTVLSGTLQVANATMAFPSTGVLTVAGEDRWC